MYTEKSVTIFSSILFPDNYTIFLYLYFKEELNVFLM